MNSTRSLTKKVFRITIASFFVANFMMLLGSVIDGFVVGNNLDANRIAAIGLASPAVILFAVIGAVAGSSFQGRSLRCLNRGDVDGAGRALTETLIIGLGLSIVLMVFILAQSRSFALGIGIQKNNASFSLCVDYLRGLAIGLPAMTAMDILSRGVQIDGNHRVSIWAMMVMTILNFICDFMGTHFLGFDLFGIALTTSISYYAGAAVLVWYYRKPDILIKPITKGISLKETAMVNNIGLWGGIIYVVSGMTLVLRADVLNVSIDLFNIGSAGMQAYNVQVQMNYIVSMFQGSAVAAMFLLADLCVAEEDRVGFKKFISEIVRYDIIAAGALSLIMFVFADSIAWLYLGDAGADVLADAAGVLRACSIGIIFQTIVLMFANYIQLFGHNIIAIMVIVTSNFIVPLIGASFGGEFAKMKSGSIIVCMFVGITACHIISALLLLPLVPIVNRGIHKKDYWWMLPSDFGTAPENEIRAMITTPQEVMQFTEKAWEFCRVKGESQRTCYLTSLAIEEMGMNVVTHGFVKDDRKHTLSIRLVHKGDELLLRFRDDCRGFDPRKKYEAFFGSEDVSKLIGIRMIMAEAKEVRYTTLLHLNNLIICISPKDTKEETAESSQ